MALPKGVKSPVDYTKLYMSNELDGEVIDESKGKLIKTGLKALSRGISKKVMKTPITKNFRGATTYSGKKISNVGKTVVQSRGSSLAPKGATQAVTDVMKVSLGGALAAPVIQTAIDVKNLKKQQKQDKQLLKDYEDYIRKNELIQASHQPEGELTEKTMTSAQKRKDTMLKKKYDDSDMKKNMIAQYGKEEGTKIYFAKIRKEAMKEELNKDDKPFVKKLVGKLRKGSKTHAKQADDLEKAMKEDTAIESELLIQDWNKDDIKFTEIETVDIIKAKPLKDAELYEGFKTRMIAKFGKKLIKNIGKVNPFTKTGAQRVTGDVIKKTTPKIKGAFDVTGTQAAQMQRSKGGIKFPVRDATSKQISKNIQTKSIINQTKKANELGMKKLSNMKGSSGKDLSKPVKVNLSKPIDFDKYIGGQKSPVKKIYGTKKPTGTFTDDLPPVKTVPLNKSQTDLMKKLGKPKKKITKKKLTQQQQQQAQKGKEKPKTDKPLQDHYDWREDLGEDWQSINRKDKTDGMSKAAVKAYRRENPGSKLKTAVTKDPKKLKKGSKSAKRRLAFCRRMKGMKKKLTSAKTRRDPDSRINKALRRWNC